MMTPIVTLDHSFYPEHSELFEELLDTVSWDESMKARKTASFGKPYDYSQMNYPTSSLLPCLQPLRNSLSKCLKIPLNNCLINYYQTGQNTMGFHSDDTSNLVEGTGVAIVSLGSERSITFRSQDHSAVVEYNLQAGSMLYMGADVQKNWQHAIKKADNAGPRISLTWRAIR